ncbi:glycoside hydrolase family 13 protein [Nakamurella sp. YIM 132084]|uniref:Glycoside hydrolase family 13 protein n=1 Tax=Nakamurella leprariae TaxID=2803911 RepID=A0A938Y9J0_9ACTN|nr:glycoside hydrolase family 13 protein [Nakamurella leprariae]
MVRVGPHHDGSALYVGTARPALGDRVPVRVRVPARGGVRSVSLRVLQDAEPTWVDATPDGADAGERWFTAEVPIHNPVTSYRVHLDRGRSGYSWLNGTGEHARDITDLADFRLTTFDPGPDWALDAVVYQVFPDRFARSGAERPVPAWAIPADWDDPVIPSGPGVSEQFYGGDLDGIRERLSHLQQLGITTLYLTPIFPARSNHRYNATTFETVDPLLGGDAALARLAGACHDAGLRIVGDLTTNHSGDDHAWFRAALADPMAPERSFYYFGDRDDYASWLGHRSLPKFDLESLELRDRMFGPGDSVVARWLREPYDLDGWRIDVANMTGRHGAHDHGAAVARLIRGTLAAVRPDSVLIAEYTNDFTADLRGDGWQGSMNYAGFGRPVWSWLVGPEYEESLLGVGSRIVRRPGTENVDTMRDFAAAVPWAVAARHWNLISSHDTARIRTVTGSGEASRLAAVMLMTYLGTPMVYAGDELGLQGRNGEDGRRPMPWDRPDRWDDETLRLHQELIALRRRHPALCRGGLRWVVRQADAIAFLRETADERLLVGAARAPWSGARLPRTLAPDGVAETLHGGVDLTITDAAVEVPGDGPIAAVWRLA